MAHLTGKFRVSCFSLVELLETDGTRKFYFLLVESSERWSVYGKVSQSLRVTLATSSSDKGFSPLLCSAGSQALVLIGLALACTMCPPLITLLPRKNSDWPNLQQVFSSILDQKSKGQERGNGPQCLKVNSNSQKSSLALGGVGNGSS